MLLHALIPAVVVDGHPFKALVKANFKVKCGLKIDLLVNHEPGSVFTSRGDLDNRLKTLLDGLRLPTSQQEIKNYVDSEFLQKNDFTCLLENDVLITALDVEMQRWLDAPEDVGEDCVRANIDVRLEPTEDTDVGQTFQTD